MNDAGKSRRFNLYVFAVFFALFDAIASASNDMIMPGMLQVVNQFKAGLSYVAASFSVFVLGCTFLQLFIGPWADKYGKRRVLLIGNALFVVFTVVTMLSTDIIHFMLGRFLQGACLAFIAIGYTMIHEEFDDESAVKLIALMGNITILAPLVGPVLGGLIVRYANWRYVFFIIGLISIISLFGLIRYTQPGRKSLDRIDAKSIMLSYLAILKDRKFMIASCSMCLTFIPLIAWIGMAPVLIMNTARLGFTEYIIFQLIAIGGLSISSILVQFVAGNYSFYTIMSSGNAVFIAGGIWILCFSWSPFMLAIGFFLNTFGLGLFNGVNFRIIMTSVNYSRNMIMSLLAFMQTIAISISLEVVNTVCGWYAFSFFSFALIVFMITVSGSVCMYFFSNMNKERKWE